MSSFQKTKGLTPTSTDPSQTNWKQHTTKSIQNQSTENASSSTRKTTRQHVPLVTRQKLLELGWEVLIYQLYSPDIAPTDLNLFWSLQNSLNGENFNFLKDCKRHLEQFFAQNDKKFWEDGIMKLPGKCQKTVGQKSLHCSIKFSVKMKSVSLIFT